MHLASYAPWLWCCLLLAPMVRAQSLDTLQASESDTLQASQSDESFPSGNVLLAGTLLIPSGPGPFPGVVLVHGSGTSDRSNPWTSAYAAALVERGIAVLHPDKRGSGESGGDWQDAAFADLADDALAGLELLKTHPLVDGTRVGLIGFSQGGHIVPLAATRSSAVSFVVNISGSVVPMFEQIGDELLRMGKREGLTPNQLNAVQNIHELAGHYASTGEGWSDYFDALAEAKADELGEANVIRGFPTEPDSPAWDFLLTIGDFDPLPYWQKIDVPTLFMYGGRDDNVDVFKSAHIIEDSLTPAGVRYSLLLFGTNGHALFREDAMEFIARWIHDGGID